MKYLVAIGLLFLCACGPREIGEGSSPELSGPVQASGADMLRMPMAGANNTQKLLYWLNRPDVMQSVQEWRANQFRRSLNPSPEHPSYREIPKQRSPFRQ